MTLFHAFQNLNPARFLDRNPYVRNIYDVLDALPSLLAQWKAMPYPWHINLRIAALHLVAVIGYAWGCNIDCRVSAGGDGIIVRSSRGEFLFEKDNDEDEKHRRMGILGRPGADGGVLRRDCDLPGNGIAGDVKIAVVCPFLIAELRQDNDAIQRVYHSLCRQTRKPDLILFVDDGSPVHVIPDEMQLFHEDKAVPTVIHRFEQNHGPAAARNAGIDLAVALLGHDPGRTIVFLLDIDCVAPPEWIQHGYNAITAHRPDILDRQTQVEPLIVAGITSGMNPASFYTLYNDHLGILNPRILRSGLEAEKIDGKPLYGPTCNLIVLPGSVNARTALPRFHEGFREAAQEDVLFCLEAVNLRGCKFIMDKVGHFHAPHVPVFQY